MSKLSPLRNSLASLIVMSISTYTAGQEIGCDSEIDYYLGFVGIPENQSQDSYQKLIFEILTREGFTESAPSIREEDKDKCYLPGLVPVPTENSKMTIVFYKDYGEDFPPKDLEEIMESLREGLIERGYTNASPFVMKGSLDVAERGVISIH